MLFSRDKAPAWGLLIALLLCFILNDHVFKNIIARPRPYIALQGVSYVGGIAKPSGYSFPSGHAANGMAAAMGFFFLTKSKWRYALVTLAVLIGLSRVYLKVHYLTDVGAGFLLGVGVAFVASLLVRGWYARGRKRRRR